MEPAMLTAATSTSNTDGRKAITIDCRRWQPIWCADALPSLQLSVVRRKLWRRGRNTTIPIVFQVGADPVEMGLVASLNRPGGNVTGVTSLNLEVGTKRLELMHVLLPKAANMAVLVNPSNVTNTEGDTKALQTAAGALKLVLYVLQASADRDLDKAFATLSQQRIGGLVIGPDLFLQSRAEQIERASQAQPKSPRSSSRPAGWALRASCRSG
jgi:hypothetical protein